MWRIKSMLIQPFSVFCKLLVCAPLSGKAEYSFI